MNGRGEWKGLVSLSGGGLGASHWASHRVQYICRIYYSAQSVEREVLTMLVTCVKQIFNLQVTKLVTRSCSAVQECEGRPSLSRLECAFLQSPSAQNF